MSFAAVREKQVPGRIASEKNNTNFGRRLHTNDEERRLTAKNVHRQKKVVDLL